jgi:hypothetical protein
MPLDQIPMIEGWRLMIEDRNTKIMMILFQSTIINNQSRGAAWTFF